MSRDDTLLGVPRVPRMVVPRPPPIALEPNPHRPTNDVFFGTRDTLDPVPQAPRVAAPSPDAARGLQFEDPPPPYVYRQPAGEDRQPPPTYTYRPGPARADLTPAVLGLDQETDARGSVGTAIQMAALGPQNHVLDINPQMSFFRAVHRRHTAFATECFEQDVALRLGETTTVTIQRRGDMLGDLILQVRLPSLGIPGGAWADAVGYVLLSRARLILDEVVIHDQERLWYDLVDRVFMPHGRKAAIDAMIGRGAALPTDREHTVFLPFKFFCCRNHHATQQFLPLAALAPRSTLTLEFTAADLAGLVVLPPGAALPPAPPPLRALLLTEQTFVEQDEQRAAWQRGGLLLVETAQDVDALNYRFDDQASFAVDAVTLDLRELNLPVRSLLFVAYDENAAQGRRYFEYVDCVRSATLLVGSSQRFAPRGGDYFSLVQTYQHAGRCSPDRVHMYSFALDAAQRQPCGALNFAVVDGPTVRVDLAPAAQGRNLKVKAFAQGVNWLAIERGSAAFMFAA